jgi:hypothetical protein
MHGKIYKYKRTIMLKDMNSKDKKHLHNFKKRGVLYG